jgi:hypothetical protein
MAHDPELLEAVAATLWRLDLARSSDDNSDEAKEQLSRDASAVLDAIAMFRPTGPLIEEWVEWGVRRSRGDGSIAHFGHGELTARRAADTYPGTVIRRWVAAAASEWEEA